MDKLLNVKNDDDTYRSQSCLAILLSRTCEQLSLSFSTSSLVETCSRQRNHTASQAVSAACVPTERWEP